jgi:tetratricopeptide (TPR) repeat protein
MPGRTPSLPSPTDALARQALAAQQQGRQQAAEALWRQVLQADPAHPQALAMLALILAGRGDTAAAIDMLARSLQRDPDNIATQFNSALLLLQAGRAAEALAGFERVLARHPGDLRVLDSMGKALHRLGRHEEALACYARVLQAQPRNAELLNRQGMVFYQAGSKEEAAEAFRQSLALAPDNAEALMNLGVAQLALLRHADALASLERALVLDPQQSDVQLNLANALAALDRYDEAIAIYRRLLAREPDDVDALMNLANALRDMQRYDEAPALYERALALDPGSAGVRWNHSLCLLAAGDHERGWPGYEVRFQVRRLGNAERAFEAPRWHGDAPLAGKTILLHAEQGLGDALQFCRYAPLVAALGARVVFEVHRPLLGVMATLEGVHTLIGRGDTLPPHDFHCPLMSLPLALGTRPQTIPAQVPYLRADTALAARWRSVVSAERAPRIGLAWTGNRDYPENRRRSVDLAQLLAALPAEASVWSLLPDEDVPAGIPAAADGSGGPPLRRFEETRFVHTAAQIGALDLVIAVDTSIVHLAGALGAPTWLLLPYVADWRWPAGRTDSPWYPTLRVFRQPSPGNWAAVLADVRRALSETP